MSHLSYAEAIVVGLLQGASELFPISSLGHSVLLPALVGGQWAKDLNVSAPESPYLAFIVGLHVATALALLLFFWRDWIRIVTAFASSLWQRRIDTPDQRLAWLIVLATIPVGAAGLALEHTFRTTLGKPNPAAVFLIVNGFVLLLGERLRRMAAARPGAPGEDRPEPARTGVDGWQQAPRGGPHSPAARTGPDGLPAPAGARPSVAPNAAGPAHRGGAHRAEPDPEDSSAADERLGELGVLPGTLIGAAQIFALLPGISRSGITMVAGMARGLSHEDAARFSFLLATPVILGAGALKIPDLFGPLGAGIHGPVLAGSICSFVTALLSVRFLVKYFQTRTLTPFAIYCMVAGAASLAWLTVHG